MHDINKNSNKRGQRKNRQSGQKRSRRGARELVELRRFTQPRDPIMKFVRTATDVVSIQPNTGINASGFDICYTFSLSTTNRYVAGVLGSAISNPGSSDFTALYDQWRIDAVELAFMFGANSVPTGTLATAQLPIFNFVYDPSDSSVISLSSILQYQELHTVQLGNQQNTSNGYTIRIVPYSRVLDGSSSTYAVDGSKWINIDSPAVEHFGVKGFYDSAGSTLTTVIGSVTVYIKYFLSMKRSR